MVRVILMAVLLGAVTGTATLRAQDQWIRVTSPHFELYTSEGRLTAVYTIRHFEQVRGFFVNALKLKVDESQRVRLVAFRSTREFQRFLEFKWGAAYYLKGRDGDYIVMRRTGEQFSKTAVHEYVHLLVQHARMKLPAWLNEGMAEFYATLRPLGGKVRVGEFDPSRTYVLMNSKWLPLAELLGSDQKTAYEGSENKVGVFYAQSWALTHMLIMDDGYGAKFPDFLKVIQKSPAEEAFPQVYGKTIEQVDKDLNRYLRGNSYNVMNVDAKLERMSESPEVSPLPDNSAALVMARVLMNTGKVEAAMEELQPLLRSQPEDSELNELLGWLAASRGENQQAIQHLGKAVAGGVSSGKMFELYAKLLWDQGRHDEAIQVFRQMLEADPQDVDARLLLASMLFHEGKAGEALGVLAKVKQATRKQATRTYQLRAYCQWRLGAVEQAKQTAALALKSAEEPEELEQAEELVAQLNSSAPPPGNPPEVHLAAAKREAPPDEQPHLERREEAASANPPPIAGKDFKETAAVFELLDCRPEGARFHFQTESGKLVLAVKDPALVVILGKDTGAVDLECGKQAGQPNVRVAWEEENPPAGAAGVMRRLEFR